VLVRQLLKWKLSEFARRLSATFGRPVKMKLILFNALFLLVAHSCQDPSQNPALKIADPKFDEWHDLVFSDEKSRLDNISIVWREQPRSVIYLIVYAGKSACVGEAKARGIRAKNYLIKRYVPANNIVWIDGGWKDEVTTEVWLWPPGVEKPSIFPEFNLKASEVKLEKGCKIKYRGATK